MSIKIRGNAFSPSNSDAGYFETLFKKFDEKRAELQTAIDAYFAEAEKKKNELKDIADIVTSAKDTAVRAKEYAYDSAKNCLSGANSAASSALKCENYVISAKKCLENIDGIYEIIKKIEHNVEELEGNAQAFANEAETYAKKCADLSDNALESAHKSEHYALKSELAFESARIAREKCEDILSDIKFYEKSVLDAEERIEKAITVKTISTNGKKLEPDENKNVDLPLAKAGEALAKCDETTDGEFALKYYSYSGGDAGLMPANDKTKLDLIEDGATHNELAYFTEETTMQGGKAQTVLKGHNGLVTAFEREKLQNLNFIYRGEKDSYSQLPTGEIVLPDTGLPQAYGEVEEGDVYKVKAANGNIPANSFYYYDGSGWRPFGGETVAFDGSITVDVLSDKINCPRTIGLFKVVSSANVGFCGILYSSGMGNDATFASRQIIIMPRGISLNFIKIRKWDATANQWSDWDIIKPKSTETPTITQPCALNTIYSINQTSANSSVVIVLPEGGVGDFIQYDFVTGTTAPTVTIQSTYGMTEFDFTPEASKIYSLFFDWGIIAVENSANVYGWRISYAEYDYTQSTAETTGNDTVVKANDDDL